MNEFEMIDIAMRSRELAALLFLVFALLVAVVAVHLSRLSQQRRQALLQLLAGSLHLVGGDANHLPATPVSPTNDRSTPASGRRGQSMQVAGSGHGEETFSPLAGEETVIPGRRSGRDVAANPTRESRHHAAVSR